MADEVQETPLAKIEPWEQYPGEPKEAFLRFQRFLNLGYRRTLRRLYLAECKESKTEPNHTTPASYRKAAELWDWVKRCHAWEEAAINEDARLKAIRRAELREDEFGLAQLLISKAKDMLKFPLQQVTHTGEDGKVTIINPAEWRLTDVATIIETASKLGRLSLDMSQGRMEITPVMQEQATPIDDMMWLKETAMRGQEIPGVVVKVEDKIESNEPSGMPTTLPAGDTAVDQPNDSGNTAGSNAGNTQAN